MFLRTLASLLLFFTPAWAASSLPEGPGKRAVEQLCAGCHGLIVVTGTNRTPREWQAEVDNMIARGARGKKGDFAAAVSYLSAHFGTRPAGTDAPVSLNAPKAVNHADVAGLTGWPAYGNDPGGMRYSPLKQIDTGNVARLARTWKYDVGGQGKNFEVTPLVVNDTMYLSTPTQRVVALEPETGRMVWEYDPHVTGLTGHRGVSYWPGDNKTAPRILIATADARLIALDARTGKPAQAFGDNGQINLRTGVADEYPKSPYSITSPPAIYHDLAIVGPQVQEGPSLGPSGDARAFDIRTGKLVWRFHTLPQPGEEGNATWGPDGWKGRAGPSLWSLVTVDVDRGLAFLPIGNPADSFYGADRKGANLYANSVVAVDAATGKLRWYFQAVHHDIFDNDVPAAPALIDVTRDGRTIPAVAQITKAGLLFLLDRLTGKPLFGVEERPVPRSDVPGEESWPTQPFPLKPPPLSRMSLTEAELGNLSPESRRFCKDLLEQYPNQGPYTPFSMHGSSMFPGTLGGGDWGGVSFDPVTHRIFVAVSNVGAIGRMVKVPGRTLAPSGVAAAPYRNEAGYARFVDRDHYPCNPPPWGELIAINADTADIVWRVPLGSYQELEQKGFKNTGTPVLGGPVVTAGGLVFIAGTNDGYIRALDSRTGVVLWSAKLDGVGDATPMTYQGRDGKQYVVIATGGSGHMRSVGQPPEENDALIAFALP